LAWLGLAWLGLAWLGLAYAARKGPFLNMWDFCTRHSLMHGNGKHTVLYGSFNDCNLHSLRQRVVFYYDVLSIQPYPETSILAWTDICIDTSTEFQPLSHVCR
jgi:hypothetical protein